jgi:peptide/nickel transport system permease protein
MPRIFRYARNVVSAARRAPHVLSAHAFGIPRIRLIARWVAMPVLPDLVALAGVSVSMAVGATVPVEAICDSPGVGHLVWQAALSRDVPVLVNVTLLIAALTAGANLLADAARAAQERTT